MGHSGGMCTRVEVRMGEADVSLLERLAAEEGVTRSEAVRRAVRGYYGNVRRVRWDVQTLKVIMNIINSMHDLKVAISRTGNNINQIARALNQGEHPESMRREADAMIRHYSLAVSMLQHIEEVIEGVGD